MTERTRLQVVALEFIVADESLRKSMLREERLRDTIKRLKMLMRPANPKRIEVDGVYGKEIWSLPIEGVNQ